MKMIFSIVEDECPEYYDFFVGQELVSRIHAYTWERLDGLGRGHIFEAIVGVAQRLNRPEEK